MAGRLGRRARVRGREPDAGRPAARAALLHARDAPVPVRRAAHGARPQLHAGRRRHALPPPQRLHRPAADGLRLVRSAGRERRDQGRRPPARDHRAEHRRDREADAPHGLGDRLGSRGLRPRAVVLPLDAVAVPEVLRARARLPARGAGQVVPARPDRPLERARGRRSLLALRHDRRDAEHGAVVLPDHRVRRRADRRPGHGRLARALEEDPARPHRPLRGRRGAVPRRGARPRHPGLHDAARHAVRRDVLRDRAGVAARPGAGRGQRGGALVRSHRSRPPDRGAGDAREDRRLHRGATRRTRSTANRCRSGSPTTC